MQPKRKRPTGELQRNHDAGVPTPAATSRRRLARGRAVPRTGRDQGIDHPLVAAPTQETGLDPALVEQLPCVLYIANCDAVWSTRYVNRAIELLLGFSPAAWVANPTLWATQIHPDDRARVLAARQHSRETGAQFHEKYRLYTREGGEVWVEDRSVAVVERDPSGRARAVFGMMLDMTEREKTHEALRESEGRYRTLVETARDVIYELAPDGTLTSLNPIFETITGWSRQEWLGKPFIPILHPDDVPRAVQMFQQALEGKTLPVFELRVRTKSGEYRTGEFVATPQLRGGQVCRVVGVSRDITERKQAEAKLRESEERCRTVYDASPDLIYLTDPSGRILHANPALLSRVGMSLGEIQQKTFWDFFVGDNREELAHALARLRHGEAVRGLEIRVGAPGAQPSTYEINAIPILENGVVTQILSVARDITSRQAAQNFQHFIHHIADTVPDILYLYHVEKQAITWVNRRVADVLGYTPEEIHAMGSDVTRTLIHPDDVERVTNYPRRFAAAGEHTPPEELTYRVKNVAGEYVWLHARERVFSRGPNGQPIEVLGAAQDVSQRKRMEVLLRQREIHPQKMGENLQRFRSQLGMAQGAFGKAFGGFSQRQVTAMETGETEIPLRLLLALREKGHSLEVILGEGASDALDATTGYLSSSQQSHSLALKLAGALLHLLTDESRTIETLLREMGIPPRREYTATIHRRLEALFARAEKGSP